jgi:hypothetical protein
MESEDWKTAKLPTLYSKAKQAMAQCATVDECASWKNKMTALASYARQTHDNEMLHHANVIRNRAIARQGEILTGVDKTSGRPPENFPPQQGKLPGRIEVAKAAGMSKREQEVAMRVYKMETENPAEFEARVHEPGLGCYPKPPRRTEFDKWMGAVDQVAMSPIGGFKRQHAASLLPRVEKALKVLTKAAIAMKRAK